MKISVIIPAARSPGRVQSIVDYLHANNAADLDIVVSSPGFEIDGVRNVKDDMTGSSRAIADALKYTDSDSQFIAWLSDICLPMDDNLDVMVAFLDSMVAPVIAEFRTSIYSENNTYRVCTITGKQYARWGMVSRHSMELCGGFFDPAFACFFGDVDFSLRCWKAGGHVLTCENALIKMDGQKDNITTSNWARSRESDRTTFINKWAEDYPVMRTEDDSKWNVDRVLTRTQ